MALDTRSNAHVCSFHYLVLTCSLLRIRIYIPALAESGADTAREAVSISAISFAARVVGSSSLALFALFLVCSVVGGSSSSSLCADGWTADESFLQRLSAAFRARDTR